MWRDAWLVAGKDLRIEARTRVVLAEVAPFALVVLVLFAFVLDPERGTLRQAAAGLLWMTVLFSTLLAVARSFVLEAADSAKDGLRLSGLDPAGVFLGKAGAVALELLALEALLAAGVVVLYGAHLGGLGEFALIAVLATAGLSAAGTIYGALLSGLRVRETLLPLVLLPVLAPVLLAATEASGVAFSGGGLSPGWLELLGVFAALYVALGVVLFGPVLEES